MRSATSLLLAVKSLRGAPVGRLRLRRAGAPVGRRRPPRRWGWNQTETGDWGFGDSSFSQLPNRYLASKEIQGVLRKIAFKLLVQSEF